MASRKILVGRGLALLVGVHFVACEIALFIVVIGASAAAGEPLRNIAWPKVVAIAPVEVPCMAAWDLFNSGPSTRDAGWQAAAIGIYAGLMVVGLIVFRRWYITWEVHQGICAVCGYDLRATPDRCPECGSIPKPTT